MVVATLHVASFLNFLFRQLEAYLWAQSRSTAPVIIERGGKRYTFQASFRHYFSTARFSAINAR